MCGCVNLTTGEGWWFLPGALKCRTCLIANRKDPSLIPKFSNYTFPLRLLQTEGSSIRPAAEGVQLVPQLVLLISIPCWVCGQQ
jgi:hypothetical protein